MDKRAAIETEVARLGPLAPAGYFLALRLRGASPLMTFSTFPEGWTDDYMAKGYMMRDPVTTWALTIGGSIRWNSPFLPDPFGIFREAASYGLKHGASIAHGPIGSLTICSLARSDRELTDAEIAEAKRVVLGLHDMTEMPKSLAVQDRELLEAGHGAALAKVARKLGLDEDAAMARVRALCADFLVSSPPDALKRARDLKLL